MCTKSEGFRTLGIIEVVLYRKTTRNCVMYDVPIKPHKTRGRSHPPFSIYAFENSGSKQKGGPRDLHKYLPVRSTFLYTCYLHIF
jgi:hypothetical protein